MSKAHFSSKIFPFAEQAGARERARIRRVQSRAMKALASVTASAGDYIHMADLHDYLSAISAATRPEPKRKRGAK